FLCWAERRLVLSRPSFAHPSDKRSVNVKRASGILVASAVTLWAGCSDIEKLIEPEEEEKKASKITLSAQASTVPIGGTTSVGVRVTQADGSPVKDGTKVDTTATLGQIEPTDVRTQDGGANVTYRAGGKPGTDKVTAVSGDARAELMLTVGAAPNVPAPNVPAAPPPPTGATFDLRQVTWLDVYVSSWPQPSGVTSASIDDPPICIHHTKAGQWPVKDGVEGNPWIFVYLNGRWYGATFEWLSPGQECKYVTRSDIGAHIGRSPLTGWRPRSGEVVGLMVSTRARSGADTISERSNVVMVPWP